MSYNDEYRHEAWTLLRQKVTDITLVLNERQPVMTWAVDPCEPEDRLFHSRVEVSGKTLTQSGYKLWFEYQDRNRFEKATCSVVGIPKPDREYWKLSDLDIPDAGFTVSREAAAIATDLQKRIIEPYTEQYAELLKQIDEWRKSDADMDAYLDGLRHLPGIKISDWRYPGSRQSVQNDIRVSLGDLSADITVWRNGQPHIDCRNTTSVSPAFLKAMLIGVSHYRLPSGLDADKSPSPKPDTGESTGGQAAEESAQTPGPNPIAIHIGTQAAKKCNSFEIDDAAISIH